VQRVCGKEERDVGMAHCGKWSSGVPRGIRGSSQLSVNALVSALQMRPLETIRT
jgi:hypothetical protein